MAAQVFAFILHKDGKADDTALELAAASQRIAPGATPVAIVTGAGAAVDGVCQELTASYAEVWKFAGDALAYPNAEIIRTLLLKVLPKGSTLLLPHTTFGMDLGPGLAIKMDAAYVSDVTAIDGLDGATLKVVRQEFNGQVSAHLACDMSKGAVVSVRSGCFQPGVAGAAGGKVVDKSGEVGEISARRRFVEVLQAEVGDVDITKEDVLVSVGRGIGDKEGGHLGQDRQAQGLPGARHQRVLPAHGRAQGQPLYRRRQQKPQGAHFSGSQRGGGGGSAGVRAGADRENNVSEVIA